MPLCQVAFALFALLTPSLWGADPDGAALFKARCASCHEDNRPRTPTRDELATRPPESIVTAMFGGVMVVQASGLSQDEGRAIALYITGKNVSESAGPMAGQCINPAKSFAVAPADWNGWGFDAGNSRYQPNPGLTAADIPKLKVKWAFGFLNGTSAYSQPTVAGGRVFVGSDNGDVYSLDASTGCIYWTYKAGAGVRNAIRISRSKTGNRYLAYFGDIQGFTHAVDAETGAPVWKTRVEDHPSARLTGAPAFYNGTLYVPVSSFEELSAAQPAYECCKFRGSVVALDSETGKQIWKSFSVLDPPKAFKKSKTGTQLFGPAGAAIWSAPTIDTQRKLVYVATGDSYTDVDINTSDAIIAYDLETGRIAWVSQVQAKDNYVVGCPSSPNCPDPRGPDFDFGSSPILRSIGGGKQILVAAQKSGVVYGLDPDQKGKIVWQTRVGAGSALGGVEWGHAADDQNTYAAVADLNVRNGAQPGIYALRLATGEKVWSTPAPTVTCASARGCNPAQSAAVSVIPGAVFSGSLNGHFRAYSTATGEILWDFDTARPFETVNKVPAHGASIDGPGPTIVNGMVYTNSGYGAFGAASGNVLIAFSVDGK
ncbi:MAG: PQQ-binding-like beta-propeller repeat protein [Bryobacteraceae bacterium]